MKIKGVSLIQPKPVEIFFPRGNDEGFNLKIFPVTNWEEFDNLVPPVQPVYRVYPNGGKEIDLKHPSYMLAVNNRNEKLGQYLVIKGLSQDPDFTFEKVKLEDPTTWKLLEEEFLEAKLLPTEIGRITQASIQVNNLSEEMIEDARKRFRDVQKANDIVE